MTTETTMPFVYESQIRSVTIAIRWERVGQNYVGTVPWINSLQAFLLRWDEDLGKFQVSCCLTHETSHLTELNDAMHCALLMLRQHVGGFFHFLSEGGLR